MINNSVDHGFAVPSTLSPGRATAMVFTKQNPPSGYYVYAYIRSIDSITSDAGTPYYIGKGYKSRAWNQHKNVPVPKDKTKIIILESNLTELGAFALERRMIAWHGRKNNNTGILINRSDGGEGVSGNKWVATPEQCAAISKRMKGKKLGPQSPEHAAKSRIACLGKKLPEEAMKKRSTTRVGLKYKKNIDYKQTRNKGPNTKPRSDIGVKRKPYKKREVIIQTLDDLPDLF